jgi:hypothetical protein
MQQRQAGLDRAEHTKDDGVSWKNCEVRMQFLYLHVSHLSIGH